jgi:hypothetical protein
MIRPLAFGLLAIALSAGPIDGRVTDGHRGLAGVRVYPDRLPRVSPAGDVPLALTDAEGRFHLELAANDTVLAVEKDGWCRDLVPAAEWPRDLVLHPNPAFRHPAPESGLSAGICPPRAPRLHG